MADEQLRQFYSRVVAILVPTLNARTAVKNGDDAGIEKAFREFLAATDGWTDLIASVNAFRLRRTDWSFDFVLWRHTAVDGCDYPKPPPPPPGMPDCPEALEIVRAVEILRKYVQNDRRFVDQIGIETEIFPITTNVSLLRQTIDAANKGADDDGPIDRNRLAKLLNLDPKTLANRAGELPEPIRRGERGVPIYLYLDAKAAISVMYPDRAFMLPSYKEAIEKTNEVSTEGNISRDLP